MLTPRFSLEVTKTRRNRKEDSQAGAPDCTVVSRSADGGNLFGGFADGPALPQTPRNDREENHPLAGRHRRTSKVTALIPPGIKESSPQVTNLP